MSRIDALVCFVLGFFVVNGPIIEAIRRYGDETDVWGAFERLMFNSSLEQWDKMRTCVFTGIFMIMFGAFFAFAMPH